MRIQSIQNNNTNFQGLHGNKSILKKLTPEILQKSGIQECADSFEVTVTKKGCSASCLLGAICGHFASLGELVFQAGEKVEKDKNGKTVLAGATTLKYSLEELKDSKRSLKEKLDVEIVDNARETVNDSNTPNKVREINKDNINEYVQSGKLDLMSIAAFTIKPLLNETTMKTFIKQMTTPDAEGNLPAHKFLKHDDIYRMNEYLRGYPDALAEVYLTRNNYGKLPIQSRATMENMGTLYNIYMALKDLPRVLLTVFEDKGDGNSVIDYLKLVKRNDETAQNLIDFIADIKQECIDVRGEFIPIVSKSERNKKAEMENVINNMSEDGLNISKTLDLEMVKKSFGQSLNSTDFISKTINYLIDNASNDERQEIIGKLKKLTSIDYNKVDENGISVVEKIFNSEDAELLELLKYKKLNYSRDLDYAYNRIENERFKKQVNELNFEFVDLEDAIKAYSMRAVEKCKYGFKSPLFKIEYNGTKMLYLLNALNQKWEAQRFQQNFKNEYGRYLSEYL